MGAFLRLLVLFRLWYTVDMVTLSIPQGLIKDGFVVLPRREYEDLLRAKQVNDIVVKREKLYDELDKELTESLREIKEGKVSDIFNTYEEGIKFLNSRKKFIPNEA